MSARRHSGSGKSHLALASLLSVGAAFFLLSVMMHSPGGERPIDGEKSSIEPPDNCYEMKVYTLNHTERSSVSTGTVFKFDTQDLPFEFGSLRFGDFRDDTEYSSSYYAGMGILAGASGSCATLIFLESNGKLIQEMAYHGQSLIALGGWESISTNNSGTEIDHAWGSMAIAAYDWKDGSWIPENGILIEHPANVTIAKATICLMVFEPSSTTDIPEFSLLHASLAISATIFIVRGRAVLRRAITHKTNQ